MKQLILPRGLPGSGKSTWTQLRVARHFEEDRGRSAAICSTDDYHLIDGEYVFQPEKLAHFHAQNQIRAHRYMELGTELVVIDNTNIRRKDMATYINSAQQFGYEVEEVIFGKEHLIPGDDMTKDLIDAYIEDCAKRNTHGVPLEIIAKMAARFEE